MILSLEVEYLKRSYLFLLFDLAFNDICFIFLLADLVLGCFQILPTQILRLPTHSQDINPLHHYALDKAN
jgi:hypothetical protein